MTNGTAAAYPDPSQVIRYFGSDSAGATPILTDLAVQLTQGVMRHEAKKNAGFSRQPLPNEFGVPKSVRIRGATSRELNNLRFPPVVLVYRRINRTRLRQTDCGL
jgi:hypothetical protein